MLAMRPPCCNSSKKLRGRPETMIKLPPVEGSRTKAGSVTTGKEMERAAERMIVATATEAARTGTAIVAPVIAAATVIVIVGYDSGKGRDRNQDRGSYGGSQSYSGSQGRSYQGSQGYGSQSRDTGSSRPWSGSGSSSAIGRGDPPAKRPWGESSSYQGGGGGGGDRAWKQSRTDSWQSRR